MVISNAYGYNGKENHRKTSIVAHLTEHVYFVSVSTEEKWSHLILETRLGGGIIGLEDPLSDGMTIG